MAAAFALPLFAFAGAVAPVSAAQAGDCPAGTIKVVRDGHSSCVPTPGGRVFSPYLSL